MSLTASQINDLILGVPIIDVAGLPEPDAKDKNGIHVIINPKYRRIWMKEYFPHLWNPEGSGFWYCEDCSTKGDRFYMKTHKLTGTCERSAAKYGRKSKVNKF